MPIIAILFDGPGTSSRHLSPVMNCMTMGCPWSSCTRRTDNDATWDMYSKNPGLQMKRIRQPNYNSHEKSRHHFWKKLFQPLLNTWRILTKTHLFLLNFSLNKNPGSSINAFSFNMRLRQLSEYIHTGSNHEIIFWQNQKEILAVPEWQTSQYWRCSCGIWENKAKDSTLSDLDKVCKPTFPTFLGESPTHWATDSFMVMIPWHSWKCFCTLL